MMLKLYHRTTVEAAEEIRRTGRFSSRENTGDVYFSTHAEGYATEYGGAVVCVVVPEELAVLDDWFPGNDEGHYRVPARAITPAMIEGWQGGDD